MSHLPDRREYHRFVLSCIIVTRSRRYFQIHFTTISVNYFCRINFFSRGIDRFTQIAAWRDRHYYCNRNGRSSFIMSFISAHNIHPIVIPISKLIIRSKIYAQHAASFLRHILPPSTSSKPNPPPYKSILYMLFTTLSLYASNRSWLLFVQH